MRKLTFVFLTAFQALTCTGFAFGQDKPVTVETIERIKSAAVPVVCGAPKDDGAFHVNGIMGSAFFINDEGYFVTAGHVLDGWEQISTTQAPCFSAIYIPVGGWKTTNAGVHWFRFESCVRDESADIAVCKPKDNPFVAENVKKQIGFVTFGTALNLKDGTSLAFTGFPLQFLRPVTSKGNLATYVEADKKIIVDKAAWPGASGSPLYLSDGKVLGMIIQRGTGDSGGIAVARPAEMIMDFLTKNKIRFRQQK
jgi:S1-C subfamily serine protease